MTTNITPISNRQAALAMLPQNTEEMMALAKILSQSTMVPKDYQGNPGNTYIAMHWGMALGLDPIQAVQGIAVINGRPSMWGDALLALVQGSGLLEYMHEDPTDQGCVCTVKRKGQPEVVRSFTKEDAVTAKLWGKKGYNGQDTPWTTYPKRMMQMRARALALRDAFADVLRGVQSAEEQSDVIEAEIISDEPIKPASKAEAMLSKVRQKKAIAEPVQEVDPQDFLPAVDAAEQQSQSADDPATAAITSAREALFAACKQLGMDGRAMAQDLRDRALKPYNQMSVDELEWYTEQLRVELEVASKKK